jgi:hypothetical protein
MFLYLDKIIHIIIWIYFFHPKSYMKQHLLYIESMYIRISNDGKQY